MLSAPRTCCTVDVDDDDEVEDEDEEDEDDDEGEGEEEDEEDEEDDEEEPRGGQRPRGPPRSRSEQIGRDVQAEKVLSLLHVAPKNRSNTQCCNTTQAKNVLSTICMKPSTLRVLWVKNRCQDELRTPSNPRDFLICRTRLNEIF